MSMLFAKGVELVQPFFPEDRVGVPDKPELAEGLLALIDHIGMLTFLLDLVLVPLAFDPLGERLVLGPITRHTAVPVLLLNGTQLSEARSPSTRLVHAIVSVSRGRGGLLQ